MQKDELRFEIWQDGLKVASGSGYAGQKIALRISASADAQMLKIMFPHTLVETGDEEYSRTT